jgi:hypothetical protein
VYYCLSGTPASGAGKAKSVTRHMVSFTKPNKNCDGVFDRGRGLSMGPWLRQTADDLAVKKIEATMFVTLLKNHDQSD